MTRKDYELVASAVRQVNQDLGENSDEVFAVLAPLVDELVIVFELDNPRFDSVKFLAHCGIK